MRFRKNVPAEHREFLQEQLKQYKKEITMSKDELRELEKWVASGRSPYDNGDYIYSENGCPMDFVSAMRFQDEMYESLTAALVLQRTSLKHFSGLRKVQLHFQQEEKVQDSLSTLLPVI